MSESPVTLTELRNVLNHVPRVPLGHLPTPLEPMRNLSRKLSGPTIWIKRDDCSGLAFGGNKTRHNEYLMGEALAAGADMFVWGAGVQSNNCRQTVAACAKAGLDCHLVLSTAHGSDTKSGTPEPQGNLLLDQLMGASIEFSVAEIGEPLDQVIADRAAGFREQGRRPFEWNRYSVKATAAIGYVPCLAEIVEQSQSDSFEPSAIYISSAGSTGSGLALGANALGLPWPVHSIAPIKWEWDTQADMANIANNAAERLHLPHRLTAADISLSEDYIGPAYGTPSPAGLEAMELVARHEAILLDPIYSSKAMAGLIDHVRQGQFSAEDHVVFVHTGGTPAIFAMSKLLADAIPAATVD